jgi:hypothetical protein
MINESGFSICNHCVFNIKNELKNDSEEFMCSFCQSNHTSHQEKFVPPPRFSIFWVYLVENLILILMGPI